ncbi:MAG: radical SAM protein [Desulfobacteraceae bacterium]|nr:radical SAM protein [Desulfobacteraceae bacterium]
MTTEVFPAVNHIPTKGLPEGPQCTPKFYVVPVFIPHAGCPHRCIYCDQRGITGRSKPPTPKDVHAEINLFLNHCRQDRGFTEISFFGGNFLGLPPKLIGDYLKVAEGFVAKGLVNGIRFSTRPDTITPENLRLVGGYHATTVELGVQSMNDRVLHLSERGHTAADTRHAVGLLKNRGVQIGLQLMVGLPGDEPALAMASARELADMHPDFVRIYPTLVLAQSPLAKQYHNGTYNPMDLNACVDVTADMVRVFAASGVRIVRMGLQASEELNRDTHVLAGPFHPAFGHLVWSKLFLDAVKTALSTMGRVPTDLEIGVHPADISKMRGIKNHNISELRRSGFERILVSPSPVLDNHHISIQGRIYPVIQPFPGSAF